MYLPGDIGIMKATAFPSKIGSWALRKFFVPYTDNFHHFIIREPIPDENDYEIMESIGSGVRHGRLSWYENYKVYRVAMPEAVEKGEMACRKYSRYGRARYDYVLFVKILIGLLLRELSILVVEGHFRKVKCSELVYVENESFVCTEVVDKITELMGAPVVPEGVASLPPAVQEAIDCGKLIEVTENDESHGTL